MLGGRRTSLLVYISRLELNRSAVAGANRLSLLLLQFGIPGICI
jgi:hypothetical protein